VAFWSIRKHLEIAGSDSARPTNLHRGQCAVAQKLEELGSTYRKAARGLLRRVEQFRPGHVPLVSDVVLQQCLP
jgi:hypothetical protein